MNIIFNRNSLSLMALIIFLCAIYCAYKTKNLTYKRKGQNIEKNINPIIAFIISYATLNLLTGFLLLIPGIVLEFIPEEIQLAQNADAIQIILSKIVLILRQVLPVLSYGIPIFISWKYIDFIDNKIKTNK